MENLRTIQAKREAGERCFHVHLLDGTVIEVWEREDEPNYLLKRLEDTEECDIFALGDPDLGWRYVPRRSILYVEPVEDDDLVLYPNLSEVRQPVIGMRPENRLMTPKEIDLVYPNPETNDTAYLQGYAVYLLDGTIIEYAEDYHTPGLIAYMDNCDEDELITFGDCFSGYFHVPRRSILFVRTTFVKAVDAWRVGKKKNA